MEENEQSLEEWLKEQEQYFSPSTEDQEEEPTPEELAEVARKYDPRCIEKFAGPSSPGPIPITPKNTEHNRE